MSDPERPARKMRTSRAGRLTQLGVPATGQVAKHLGMRVGNVFRSDDKAMAKLEERNAEMAERLISVLGTMKGGAQKFGQMLSMFDAGLVPGAHREEFQAKLAALQAQAPAVPWSAMRKQIERELGERLTTAYRDFDETPVASASIGQVYRAVTSEGRDVAVKVQYPGIDTAVRADLKNLALFLRTYGRVMLKAFDAGTVASELESRISEELDYVLEANNTRIVARAYREHPYIRVPDVVSELCTERVLTTEWIEGQPLSSVRDADLATRNRVAETLCRFYSGTPHRMHMYSGDPHPGNSLVLDDGTMAFLDFGLFRRIDAAEAAAERETIQATLEGDAGRLVAVLHENGVIPDPSATDPDALLEAMQTASWWYLHDEDVEVTIDRVNDVAMEFAGPGSRYFKLARQHNPSTEHLFRLRAEGLTVGVIGQLRPRLNLHRVVREWIYGDRPVTDLGRVQERWDQESGNVFTV